MVVTGTYCDLSFSAIGESVLSHADWMDLAQLINSDGHVTHLNLSHNSELSDEMAVVIANNTVLIKLEMRECGVTVKGDHQSYHPHH